MTANSLPAQPGGGRAKNYTPDMTGLSQPQATMSRLSQGADEVIETSCAVVILKGKTAYKLKKSVDFGFLDFTSAAKRRAALERELVLNRETAGDIYLRVDEVDGEAVLIMRRFDTQAVLNQMSLNDPDWTPDRVLAEKLGLMAAQFHVKATVCTDSYHAGNTAYVIGSNSENIAHFREALGPEVVDDYNAAIATAYEAAKDLIHARFYSGHIRRCHGDMHFGNILIENDQPILFDCIEFNDRLNQIDILYDLAFLLMDLWVRGYRCAANAAFNLWLETLARHEGEAAYEGLSLLPLFLSMRAAVRCHVNAHNGNMAEARTYLKAAIGFLEPQTPTFMAIGGLSGSGKSTRARHMAPIVGRSPGAVILRSDEIRKRLWGCESRQTLSAEAYTQAETERTYSAQRDIARTCLLSGHSVILDATFREADDRRQAESIAAEVGIPFKGLWLQVPAHIRAERVKGRKADVSDATAQIALAQTDVDLSSDTWEVVSSDQV